MVTALRDTAPRDTAPRDTADVVGVGGAVLRVVLAEDSYLMREGVARLLESDAGVCVVATSMDLDSTVAVVAQHRPDVLVTDIRMPPSNTDEGIRAAGLFRDTHPGLGVVVLSQYDEPEYALALLSRGAAGPTCSRTGCSTPPIWCTRSGRSRRAAR